MTLCLAFNSSEVSLKLVEVIECFESPEEYERPHKAGRFSPYSATASPSNPFTFKSHYYDQFSNDAQIDIQSGSIARQYEIDRISSPSHTITRILSRIRGHHRRLPLDSSQSARELMGHRGSRFANTLHRAFHRRIEEESQVYESAEPSRTSSTSLGPLTNTLFSLGTPVSIRRDQPQEARRIRNVVVRFRRRRERRIRMRTSVLPTRIHGRELSSDTGTDELHTTSSSHISDHDHSYSGDELPPIQQVNSLLSISDDIPVPIQQTNSFHSISEEIQPLVHTYHSLYESSEINNHQMGDITTRISDHLNTNGTNRYSEVPNVVHHQHGPHSSSHEPQSFSSSQFIDKSTTSTSSSYKDPVKRKRRTWRTSLGRALDIYKMLGKFDEVFEDPLHY